MFIVFVVINGILGAVILVGHCSCDNLVSMATPLFDHIQLYFDKLY